MGIPVPYCSALRPTLVLASGGCTVTEPLTLAQRVNLGVTFGAVAAILFSVLATIVRLGMGGQHYTDSLGISFGWTIAIYVVTLPASGVVGGVCGPLLRWVWGAFIVGTLVTLMPFAAVLLIRNNWVFRLEDLELAAVFSAVIGGVGFVIGWARTPHRRRRTEPPIP